ncbi:uncharacterized protein V1516DRAFT_682528 [Lipomyces oligophaga]|uniref:uncharacterized protein n=1 Tax=Lipomyces oligophaga TaxID=45792 RepID=UPI0034CD0470
MQVTRNIDISPHNLYCHLTISAPSSSSSNTPITLFTTTSEQMSLDAYVYAIPKRNQYQVLSTTLFGGASSTTDHSAEFATRLAKILAGKLNRPVYVGVSVVEYLNQISALEKIIEFVLASAVL